VCPGSKLLIDLLQTVEELEAVSRLCPQLVELRGVSVGVLDERYRGEKHLQVRRCCGTRTLTFCRSGTGTVILLIFFSFTFYDFTIKFDETWFFLVKSLL
jgi:hypothetical protein